MATGTNDTLHRPGVLRLREPTSPTAPVVFDIPRSGAEYPRDFRSAAPFSDVHRSISMYVEELYEDVVEAGAAWLFACFPNAYIDANRNERDIDPDLLDGPWPEPLAPTEKSRLGIGLIHRVCGTGATPLWEGKLAVADVRRRVDAYYRPYHETLAQLLAARRRDAGVAFHVSCHSMASVGGAATLDRGRGRSDFDIGDGNGTTCAPAFVEVVVEALRGHGYDVTVNRHYAGAECIRKHAAPERGVHSLQIEINRGLYMDEDTFERRPEFVRIRSHLANLAQRVTAFARDQGRPAHG